MLRDRRVSTIILAIVTNSVLGLSIDEYIKSKEIKMENNHADTCCKKWRDNLFDRSAI